MAVKLRLMRMGKKKHPTYRVVATDSRSPRDGRFIELIGRYDPHPHPSVVEIDNDRAVHWLTVGAQPSAAVRKLLEISGAWGQFRVIRGDVHVVADQVVPETKERKSKKVRQRETEATAADADLAEAEADAEKTPEDAPADAVSDEPAAEATEEPAAEAGVDEPGVEEPVAEAPEEAVTEAEEPEAAEEPATEAPEEAVTEAAEEPAAEAADEVASETEEPQAEGGSEESEKEDA